LAGSSGDIRSIIDHWESSISEGWGEKGAQRDQKQKNTVKQEQGGRWWYEKQVLDSQA
jgi:hypothetical protein